MTHNILPTDIELATRLLAAGRPDDAVITAMVHRGIDPTAAAQLVDDLRNGRRVTSQLPAGLEITPGRRSRSRRDAPSTDAPGVSGAPEPSARRQGSGRRRSESRKGFPALGIIIAAVVCVAAIVTGVLVWNHLRRPSEESHSDSQQSPTSNRGTVSPADSGAKPTNAKSPDTSGPARSPAMAAHKPATGKEQGAAVANSSAAARNTPPAPATTQPVGQRSSAELVLDFQPDGLRINGGLVVAGDIPASVSKVLGVPKRSFAGDEPDTMVYAYDQQGLLVYSGNGASKNTIILDCEGSGGENGTTSPFTGSIKVQNQVIRPGTDSKTLAAIDGLGLSNPGIEGGIWTGRYLNMNLAFAYLNTSKRLSLIEIDFK